MHERIGILGGTFNPIHIGHLAMAEAARQELGLSRVVLLPDGDPPHKAQDVAGKEHRFRMAELAAGGCFEVSRMEVDRPGKTYTVDTLETLKVLRPEVKIVMLIGADTLREIHGWHRAKRVFELCSFAVFSRDGLPLAQAPGAKVHAMQAQIPDISATEIRRRVHKGYSIAGLTPAEVVRYIGRRRLYAPPRLLSQEAMRQRLRRDLPQERYAHVLGVEETMRTLARRWGVDEALAALTGLLHDCAKGMRLSEMREFVDKMHEPVDAARRTTRELLHAPASAALARERYGVTNPDILHAIWYHNTGCVEPSALDKLLLIADMAEPHRRASEQLDAIRALSAQNVDQAVRAVLETKLGRLRESDAAIHPDTGAALAFIENSLKGEGIQ